MIYLDTAALVKLIRHEAESAALVDWLDERQGTMLVTSTLAEVEVSRALLRSDPGLLTDVPAVLARVAKYEIDEVVRRTAAAYPSPDLRSSDAIHLATAHAVFGRQLTSFVTYDMRLLAVAEALGLPTDSPGVAA
ncbi:MULTISPECIES: type II toxin-antitoxin system VapC family toxin [unclassified Amycolatopsis]|uniref:type II toxin-antitoxin system VapC family toxin n=1 Tax=unclassified Amycolatopsis TaxID=2618356 RepID=UPI0028742C73|nr:MULTISPECIES: type II toxin-antitoxin system VapC family toxin [unclassified Amycolatopsis]MDS0134037.1 type II toxin-antitoxin system VapC family toxin [Amycolatopsis sp. 505]MDS0144913.1 type II toxin-antitoxin system VapC family toxin [Amycolatopsis sp. CM201R]